MEVDKHMLLGQKWETFNQTLTLNVQVPLKFIRLTVSTFPRELNQRNTVETMYLRLFLVTLVMVSPRRFLASLLGYPRS